MFADAVPIPLKVLASGPALMYGAMIYLAEGTLRAWAVITGAVFVGLFVVLSFLEYPLGTTWPAFVLVMRALTVIRGLPYVRIGATSNALNRHSRRVSAALERPGLEEMGTLVSSGRVGGPTVGIRVI